MPEYHFTGNALIRGVDFYIEADTLDEAKVKANRGEADLIEDDNSEIYDFDINLSSGAVNQ